MPRSQQKAAGSAPPRGRRRREAAGGKSRKRFEPCNLVARRPSCSRWGRSAGACAGRRRPGTAPESLARRGRRVPRSAPRPARPGAGRAGGHM
ncbi:unnamed protein product [Prorocentrum cordatum]|uniref:Uncharacterized protein n=1 Tax=Prorocentrum cordatum TaxID=2364126 RepID=A0ABN9TZ44_9DINO|nr:unnamed protein product [Polarella glacialis]